MFRVDRLDLREQFFERTDCRADCQSFMTLNLTLHLNEVAYILAEELVVVVVDITCLRDHTRKRVVHSLPSSRQAFELISLEYMSDVYSYNTCI